MKVTERFSDRVENYLKYRPRYPKEIIPFLEKEIGLTSSSVIADIGSGTGFSAEMFLQNGDTVYGVEPNKEMREAGEQLLAAYAKFYSIDAPAESTTLPDRSIDIVIAGQAFHWFDVEKSRKEFNRILKPDGWVALIWNDRELDTTPFLTAYEKLLNTFGTDYPVVADSAIAENVGNFFSKLGYKTREFGNSQSFDYEGLEGRLLSSSYTPTPTHPNYQPMLTELRRIFDDYQENNSVLFEYKTRVYYGQLS